ncbi:hypothetical protein M0R45_008535 [Rubus argutus]|uniref:Uncharacterized protein n=1 Tax=Rubus argutus TaxID=59490 RepID=A0AAW1Y1X5_RUBAR
MHSVSFLNHHHSHIGSCHKSVRYPTPEPPMAQPGGNENSSNPLQVGLGVAPMFKRGVGSSCGSRLRLDDVKSPKSRLKAAINEERVALGEGDGGGVTGGLGFGCSGAIGR